MFKLRLVAISGLLRAAFSQDVVVSQARLLEEADGNETGETGETAGGFTLKIQGMSGKFTYSQGDADAEAVTVEFDSLSELDSDGNEVGTGGSEKHSFNNFASQKFTFSPVSEVEIGNATAKKITFSSDIGTLGTLRVDTFIVSKAGFAGPAGEEWALSPGNLKFNIALDKWDFCNPCKKGQKEEYGEFIQLDIKIKGSSETATPKEKTGGKSDFSLGGDRVLLLTNRYTADDSDLVMPASFPSIVDKGGKQVFSFRFPKFSSNLEYDPVLGGEDAPAPTPSEGENPAPTPSEGGVTPAPTPSEGDETGESAGGFSLKIKGMSGKFTYSQGDADADAVTVEFDSMTELDTDGNEVGTGGSEKHSFNSFASQKFTFSPVSEVDIGNATAKKITFSSNIGTIGTLRVDTFIVSKAGYAGPAGEEWPVSVGNVKFNIALDKWDFCDPCKKGGKDEFGQFIQLDIKIKGSSATASPKGTTGGKSDYSLGGDRLLLLTNKYTADDSDLVMPTGYPSIVEKGSGQVFSFRFPKFSSKLEYDPVLGEEPKDPVFADNAAKVAPLFLLLPAVLLSMI